MKCSIIMRCSIIMNKNKTMNKKAGDPDVWSGEFYWERLIW